jgi:hypothetical protein
MPVFRLPQEIENFNVLTYTNTLQQDQLRKKVSKIVPQLLKESYYIDKYGALFFVISVKSRSFSASKKNE